MAHADAVGPCLGLRIESEGKVVAFSGDTEWTDTLIDVGRDADLFVSECYTYQRANKLHLAWSQLEPRLAEIRAKQLVLTHMSEDMLAHRGDVPYQTAEDGMVVEF
jgi:ribonuclease BN (tRNA processing enzyme)